MKSHFISCFLFFSLPLYLAHHFHLLVLDLLCLSFFLSFFRSFLDAYSQSTIRIYLSELSKRWPIVHHNLIKKTWINILARTHTHTLTGREGEWEKEIHTSAHTQTTYNKASRNSRYESTNDNLFILCVSFRTHREEENISALTWII